MLLLLMKLQKYLGNKSPVAQILIKWNAWEKGSP